MRHYPLIATSLLDDEIAMAAEIIAPWRFKSGKFADDLLPEIIISIVGWV